MAYESQSKSLVNVQQIGPALEKQIRNALGWPSGKILYASVGKYQYKIQSDAHWPDSKNPKIFLSVTYCNPDTPGHSNENKLQLKIGELMLFKAKYPELKSILIIGGTKEAWMPYVLEVFKHFFDEVIFIWQSNFQKRISDIKISPEKVELKHQDLWKAVSKEWKKISLDLNEKPINSFLRETIWEWAKSNSKYNSPDSIPNKIFQLCMQSAFNKQRETRGKSGIEWTHYRNKNWSSLWQSRSFFNPAEAAITCILQQRNYAFYGGLAKDVAVPSLIHHFGGTNVDNTKVSEDFILFSEALNKPIFIQSKASGGGLKRHGKNIQNRTKEQVTRGLLYRGHINQNNEICLRPKDFIWVGVLDGDWGVTQATPLKYHHMLYWAGYEKLVAADDLVNEDLQPDNSLKNPLVSYLESLKPIKNIKAFKRKWIDWMSIRSKK